MTADQDPLERRLVAALAAVPDAAAAERVRARVDAVLQTGAAHARTVGRPRPHAVWLLPLVGSAVVLTIVAMLSDVWSRPERPVPIEHVVPASWARGYADIADLAADADLVVEGTVRTLVTGPGGTPPMTRVGVDVSRVLQGEAGPSIQVLQTGGATPEGSWVVLGDPPMEVDDHTLLFLRRIDGGVSAGAYVVLGGPQGRFDVAADGTIGPVGDTPVMLPTGTTVDDVAARIAALDAAALETCEAVKGSVPLAIVRSGTATVVTASLVTGERLERYLGSATEGASSSPVGMTDEAIVCLIDGDFVMRTPGPPGHEDQATRILVIVTEGRPQLRSWTRTPTALPTTTPSAAACRGLGAAREVSDTFAPAIGEGPVLAVAGEAGRMQLAREDGAWLPFKVLWVAPAGYRELVTIRDMGSEGLVPVVQDAPSATELVVDWATVRPSSRSGWKELPSLWRIPGLGCHAWEVISAEGSTSIPFETWATPDRSTPVATLHGYLEALVAGDCETARDFTAPSFVIGNGELCGGPVVHTYEMRDAPARPSPDEAIFATTLVISGGDASLEDGPMTWFYDLMQQPDGAWLIVGGGSGP